MRGVTKKLKDPLIQETIPISLLTIYYTSLFSSNIRLISKLAYTFLQLV